MTIPMDQHEQYHNELDDARSSIFELDHDDSSPQDSHEHISFAATSTPSEDGFDKSSIARLIASYGSSSSTAWLEFSRYKIWQAPVSFITEHPAAGFRPIQGYMQHKQWIFAWGNPLVSNVSLLAPAAKAFIHWAIHEQGCKPVWCCADLALETILGKDLDVGGGWSAIECIREEVLDPQHILEMTGDGQKGKEGVHAVKDLKKNLRRAERAGVVIEEVTNRWTPEERKQVEDGLADWKRSKGMKGVQIASTTGQPWIDEEHRRYLVARHEGQIVGILILTPIHGPYRPTHTPALPSTTSPTQKRKFHLPSLHLKSSSTSGTPSTPTTSSSSDSEYSDSPSPTFSAASSSSSLDTDFHLDDGHPKAPLTSHYYLIKNAISFPNAPRGTSELLIHSSLELLHKNTSQSGLRHVPKVTFGVTASDDLRPADNLSGWKIMSLSKVYSKVASTAGLLKRGDFRAKFDSKVVPMYVCYPREEGFGLDGIKSLLKVLRK